MKRPILAAFLSFVLAVSGLAGVAPAQAATGPSGLNAAVSAQTTLQSPALPDGFPSVHIVPGSTINLVSRESNVPVRIQNDFDSDVRVHVHMRPSNPRVLVPNAVEITVPANSAINAKVPVKAIANGKVFLIVWLTTFSGIKLDSQSILQMNVNADIEQTMLFAFGGAVFALGVFGAVRTLRKRRRRLLEQEQADAAAEIEAMQAAKGNS